MSTYKLNYTENGDANSLCSNSENGFSDLSSLAQSEKAVEELLIQQTPMQATENETNIQNEELLEERLLHLRTENEAHKQNEEKLEERLVQYKKQNDVLVHELDFTGLPAVFDLACMRDAMNKLGSDSNKINPL